MKLRFALIGLLAIGGLMWAEDVDDSYAALKDAVEKKDVDAVAKLAPATAKLGAALAAKPQPSDASAVENWKGRVEFGKEVSSYAEYALSAIAAGAEPAKTVELVDLLFEVNPKSQYLSTAAPAYLYALGKTGGAAKQLAGAEKILKGAPANEDALYALASGYMSSRPAQAQAYATRLTATMRAKAKPEGTSEADWDKKKSLVSGSRLLHRRGYRRADAVLEGLRYEPPSRAAVRGNESKHFGYRVFLSWIGELPAREVDGRSAEDAGRSEIQRTIGSHGRPDAGAGAAECVPDQAGIGHASRPQIISHLTNGM